MRQSEGEGRSATSLGEVPLTHKRIWRFYYPLALSWLFMSIEGPVCTGVISRLPDAKVEMAGFNLLMGLALFLESAVIDLLTTATTLVTNRQNYLALRLFTQRVLAVGFAVHAAFVFSPAFDWIVQGLMQVPPGPAQAARLGLMFMVPWSTLIGWRRFHQGVLIRYGKTRTVGAGTAIRLITLATVSVGLMYFGKLSGCQTAGISLICSVAAEAAFAHFSARSVLQHQLAIDEPGAAPYTQRQISKFHFPLSATTLVMFLGGPLSSSALARSSASELNMAAWQMANAIGWLFRSFVYALPEVVIFLGTVVQARAKLFSFAISLGALASGAMLLLSMTPASDYVFSLLFHPRDDLKAQAVLCFALLVPLPTIGAVQCYFRGVLTRHHVTTPRLVAIFAGFSTLFLGLQISVGFQANGIVGTSLANIAAQIAELIVLAGSWAWYRSRKLGTN